jgi:hypothetical protein
MAMAFRDPGQADRINSAVSTLDIILPISSGGIAHFGGELEILAQRHTGGQAPNPGSHAGLKHRWCFDDDGRDRRPPGTAKSQQEVRHATAEGVYGSGILANSSAMCLASFAARTSPSGCAAFAPLHV